jgi:hypothetical protein
MTYRTANDGFVDLRTVKFAFPVDFEGGTRFSAIAYASAQYRWKEKAKNYRQKAHSRTSTKSAHLFHIIWPRVHCPEDQFSECI